MLLHYHIYKNAGSTIKDYLDLSFGEGFQRVDQEDPDGTVNEPDFLALLNANPHFQAISSHQFRYPMPAVRGFLFFDICFLRDPLHRVQSMYTYLREKPVPGDPLSELVNRRPLGDFVAELLDTAPYRVSNLQTNLLANGSVFSEAAQEDWLDRARVRMLDTSFLGVVDCFRQSIAAGHFLLSPIFPRLISRPPEPVNVSTGFRAGSSRPGLSLAEACGPALYEELVARNRLDFALLDEARAEVTRRYNLIPQVSPDSQATAISRVT